MSLLLSNKLFLSIFCIFLVLGSQGVYAQMDTPLDPKKDPNARGIGIFGGIGGNLQSGAFTPVCEGCVFDNGNRMGFSFGVTFEQELLHNFWLGVSIGFDDRGINASYIEIEPLNVEIKEGIFEEVPVRMRHKAEVDLLAIEAIPFIKWTPVDFFFIKLGFTGSYLVGANIKHSKVLLQETAKLSTGEIRELYFADTDKREVVVEDQTFPEVNSMAFGITPMLGFSINLVQNISINPYFQYTLPLNSISEGNPDFKVHLWRVMIELNIAFVMKKSY